MASDEITVKVKIDGLEEMKKSIQEFIDLRDEAKKAKERHKEYCPYCRSVSYDDSVGNCSACGGMREKHDPKKENEEHPLRYYNPYSASERHAVSPAPTFYVDGGIPQRTVDFNDWAAR